MKNTKLQLKSFEGYYLCEYFWQKFILYFVYANNPIHYIKWNEILAFDSRKSS